MDYRITKIKTKEGKPGLPVSTTLDEIVERMRSNAKGKTVEEIAQMVTWVLASQDENGTRYGHIKQLDELPYLIFSATFGRNGLSELRQPTGLVLLSVDCGTDAQLMEATLDAVRQMRETLLAFKSVSRRSLKIVVPCLWVEGELPQDSEDYLAFLNEAQRQAAKYYSVFCNVDIAVKQESLSRGCRMSQDPNLYYNKEAQPIRIIRHSSNQSKQYPNARTDERGWTTSEPTTEQVNKERDDFYICRRKAFNDYVAESGDEHIQEDGRMTLLAQYCRRSALPEESSVIRAMRYAGTMGIEQVREIFRSVYEEKEPGRPAALMSEKERIARKVREFFNRRYELRYNEMKRIEEFRPKGHDYWPWQPLTDRELRRIAFEEMIDAGVAWSVDIELYVRSSLIKSYNPIHEFLAGCGKWDGKHNYIEELARRVPNQFDKWPAYFHRWFLGMVAQWLGKSRDYGNGVVPMLIGKQATHKSTFCKLLLPQSLREYYIDDIKLDNAEQVERMLGRMALVNIDEYNAKTDREQAKIKRILTEKDVQVRRMRSDQYVTTQRMASFIATTNERQPLTDPTGSRRYLCVEVTGIIDTDTPINYQQLYAQAMTELDMGHAYHFSKEEEAEITEHNMEYQTISTARILLESYYEPAKRSKANFIKAVDILTALQKRAKGADRPDMAKLVKALKASHFLHGAQNGIRGWYAKEKQTE